MENHRRGKMAKTFQVHDHILVPTHEKLSEKDIEKVYKQYSISFIQLPKILKTDPAIQHLGVKTGDVVKITRPSRTAAETVFFRGVVDE